MERKDEGGYSVLLQYGRHKMSFVSEDAVNKLMIDVFGGEARCRQLFTVGRMRQSGQAFQGKYSQRNVSCKQLCASRSDMSKSQILVETGRYGIFGLDERVETSLDGT